MGGSFSVTQVMNRDVPTSIVGYLGGEIRTVYPVLERAELWAEELNSPPRPMDSRDGFNYHGDVAGNIIKTNFDTGEVVKSHKVHEGLVSMVVVDPALDYVYSSGWGDNTVKATNMNDGTNLLDFKGHTQSVTSVQFRPKDRSLFSASTDGIIKKISSAGVELWSFQTNSGSVNEISLVDSALYAVTSTGELIKLNIDNGVLLWRIPSGSSNARNVSTIYGDGVYVMSSTSIVTKHGSMGELLWSVQLASGVTNNIVMAANDIEKSVIVGMHNGLIYKIFSDGRVGFVYKAKGPVRGLSEDPSRGICVGTESIGAQTDYLVKIGRNLKIVGYRD